MTRAMDWLKDLFVTPAEAADEPGTRAEVVAGYVLLGVGLILALIDLLS